MVLLTPTVAMEPFPPIAIVVTAFVLLLGLFFGLYAWLTKTRRRLMREIRANAAARGWRYGWRLRQGDPTSFRIDGETENGLTWVLKSTGTSGYARGWCVRLGLKFPTLAGKADLIILARDAGPTDVGSDVQHALAGQVAKFSKVAAETVGLWQAGREFPSGVSAFDKAYQTVALPERFSQSPVDAALAERILHWPENTITPHSLLVWLDHSGLHLQARLPSPPTWTTVRSFVALAEDLCLRLPAPEVPPASPTVTDRLMRLLE